MTIQQMSDLVYLLVRHTAYLNLMLKGLDTIHNTHTPTVWAS